MLTLRTVRLQLRIPAFRLEYPLLQEYSACRLGSIVAQSRFSQQHATQHRQQIRPYLYIPVSWTEVRERLERWLERSDSRIVQVILLKRRRRKVRAISPPLRTSRNASKSTQQQELHQKENDNSKILQHSRHGTVTKWKHVQSQLRNRYQGLPLPSLESSMSSSSSKVRKIANDYQSWKDRRKEQYGMLKSRYKSRRQAQYQRWNTKRNQVWVKIQRVLVKEYSKKEWFDELGRPLTARDSTGRFVNPWQSQSTNGVHSLTTILRWRWQRFVRENITFLPNFTFPTCAIRSEETNTKTFNKTSPLLTQAVPPLPAPNDSNLQFTWIGHSTCLFQVKNNFTILTDPIFSRRASPFKTFLGVLRDVPPAYTIEELANHQMKYCSERDGDGKFDICCITHDHYDHLDTESVIHLKDFVHLWVVPSGIGDWLMQSCSIQPSNIVELQWWQQLCVVKTKGRVVILDDHDSGGYGDDDILTITCCPSSHWSSRTLFDRNMRLWCSFAFSIPSFNFFLCSDTGYPENFPLFKQIGDTLGPFDLACIPIGAYEPRDMNKDSHCNPQEAVQIHKDLHSKRSVAIHWGSFQLTEESMDAPPRDLEDAICNEHHDSGSLQTRLRSCINFSVLGHGQTLMVNDERLFLATETDKKEQ